MKLSRHTWTEISLANLIHNLNGIKRRLNSGTEIIGVVKADAYGHGSVRVSRKLIENGVKRLAVATLNEAVLLRDNGIKTSVLVFSPISESCIRDAVAKGITQTVYSNSNIKLISEVAGGKKAKIHLKIDTGMNRLGIPYWEIEKFLDEYREAKNVEVEGVFTHLAESGAEKPDFSIEQYERFCDCLEKFEERGIKIPVKHVCNSAGIFRFTEMHLDAVRPGISLYGLYPSDAVRAIMNLKPVMTLKTKIVDIKKVKKGDTVSYNRTYKTRRDSVIATLPVGYADGYPRLLSNNGRAIVRGKIVPVAGVVCMDLCMIDVTDVRNAQIEDEVVLMGRQGKAEITCDELAEKCGTINYEIATRISDRVPRVYSTD